MGVAIISRSCREPLFYPLLFPPLLVPPFSFNHPLLLYPTFLSSVLYFRPCFRSLSLSFLLLLSKPPLTESRANRKREKKKKKKRGSGGGRNRQDIVEPDEENEERLQWRGVVRRHDERNRSFRQRMKIHHRFPATDNFGIIPFLRLETLWCGLRSTCQLDGWPIESGIGIVVVLGDGITVCLVIGDLWRWRWWKDVWLVLMCYDRFFTNIYQVNFVKSYRKLRYLTMD